MIQTFRCAETAAVFELRRSRRLPADAQQLALRKLRMLHRSASVQDLRVPPGNRLARLSGDRKGRWSIRVNDQWRICFLWADGDAFGVEIVDYH